MNYEHAEKSLNTKLAHLDVAKSRVEEILATKDRAKVERQLQTLRRCIRETNDCKYTVEEMKLAQNVGREDIEAWNKRIEEKISEADCEVARLSAWLNQPMNDENRDEQRELLKQFYELGKFPVLWHIVKNM